MGFFTKLRQKFSNRHVLSDEDREQALQIRLRKLELKKEQMEREAEIQKLKDLKIIEKLGHSGDDDFKTLMMLFAGAMQNNNTSSPTLSAKTDSNIAPALHLTEEDISEILKKVPKTYLKIAKGMKPDAIKQIIIKQVGDVDEDSLNRIVNRIKS